MGNGRKYSDEDLEACKALWMDGFSASVVALRVQPRFAWKITRNVIVGMAWRYHWPQRDVRITTRRRDGKGQRKPRTSPMAAVWRERKARGAAVSDKPPSDALGPLDPMPVEDDPTKAARLVPLADLEPHHCRWPIGDPKRQPFGFCGEQIVAGLPYCKAHALRAYTPPRPRRRTFSFHPRKPLEVVS